HADDLVTRPSAANSANAVASAALGLTPTPFEPARTERVAIAGLGKSVSLPQRCSDEMVEIADFCIDRYEARLVEVTDAGVIDHPPYERPLPGKRYAARSSRD